MATWWHLGDSFIARSAEGFIWMHLSSPHRFRWLPLLLALLPKVGIASATEVNAGPESLLTFIEVRVEMRGHAGNSLREQVNAAREHQGSPGQIVMMQEIARPERFVMLERGAPGVLAAGGMNPRTFTEGITDDLVAPPDQRLNREFDETATTNRARIDARASFYVITHVDIAAQDLTQIETALHKLAAAARQSSGNLGFEILRQTNHPNHFNLVSGWVGEAPFRAFAESAGAREFRRAVAPVIGSPYDERLFRRVD
jgi:quinol monooxygenase YgiN